MLILRLFLVLVAISVAVSFAIYFLSGDKRYLRFAWQLIKFSLVLILIGALIMAMGRIILF